MYPLYTVISSSFLKPNLFNILNIYRRRLVLEIISEIFLSQQRSCWSQTPSIFAWSTKLREQPLIFNSVGWGTSVLKHIWRAWHFAGFKLRLSGPLALLALTFFLTVHICIYFPGIEFWSWWTSGKKTFQRCNIKWWNTRRNINKRIINVISNIAMLRIFYTWYWKA